MQPPGKLRQKRHVDAMNFPTLQHASLLALTPLLVLLSGCGGPAVPTVPVTGKITFDGGPCPAQGNISFVPTEVAAGMPRRPGSANFDTDGQYSARSFKPGDGLVPGRYQVRISCYRGQPDASNPKAFREASYVAEGFQFPEVVVEAGNGPITKDFDIPMKKNLKN
jgi:hypothetical protein